LLTGGIIDVTEFRRASVRVGSTSATSISVFIGKILGTTLAVEHTHPLDGKIHTHDIVGPELALWLKGGAPSSNEEVEVWVYLRS
jgi:hypothetical protein